MYPKNFYCQFGNNTQVLVFFLLKMNEKLGLSQSECWKITGNDTRSVKPLGHQQWFESESQQHKVKSWPDLSYTVRSCWKCSLYLTNLIRHFPNWFVWFEVLIGCIDINYRPQGKVMFSEASFCFTIGLMATQSLLVLLTVQSVCILVECFLVM